MREQFVDFLMDKAEKDPKIVLIIGDVGFHFIERFKKKYPNQFINVGVCEQAMMGLAVGMANEGWKPYVYSMINFIVFRPYEQVRNDICYGNANVTLLGVKGSEAYKFLGFSHNIDEDEDLILLGKLPNIVQYVTKDPERLKEVLEDEYKRKGPAYFRL